MNHPPAFQFYADDFLAGTVSFSNDETGLYIRLLCRQWTQGFVTGEEISRLGKGMAQPSQNHVKSKFVEVDKGMFVNERLESVRQKMIAYRENRSNSGKNGAFARWHSHSTAIAQPMAKNSSPFPSPSPFKRLIAGAKSSTKRSKGYNGRLTPSQLEIYSRYEKALGKTDWEKDDLKWGKRCKQETQKAGRVVAEVENAVKEGRVKTTPAAYAEQQWKDFK